MRQLRPCFFLCHVTTRPLLKESDFKAPPGIDIRYPTHEELLAACLQGDMALDQSWLDEAQSRNDLCIAAFAGDNMVAYTWNAFDRAPHVEGVWIEFLPPYRYGYKGFVRPDHRGRRINNAIAVYSDRFCIERGYDHAISFVETHNFSSIQSSKRQYGREFVGLAGYFSCFGRFFSFRSPAVKQLGFRFVYPH